MLIGFDFQPRTRVIFGPGAIDRLGELARTLGTSALLVTDPGIVVAGHVERARRGLDAAGVNVTIFDEVRENPTTREVDQCF
ncbi:MAG TPA: iron-containing alcohol dehydrogenase, partial [Terrimicrobiaceae bacterium]|nr:iron-containing alcohol dehydrogenase [Terrimicrobiaceae bacterium]